jgi:type IV pilus assembly protein PilA
MFKFIRKRLNKKGFTLVELIFVIAILGILSAIAVPRISGFRHKAKDVANEATKKTLENAAKMYLAEYDPPSSKITWDGTSTSNGNDTWKKYIDDWPSDYTLEITSDGDIKFTEQP